MNATFTSHSGSRRCLLPATSFALLLTWSGAYAQAPGEVNDLAWCAGTKTCLQWTSTVTSSRYQVLRGVQGGLPSLLNSGIDSCDRILVQPATASGLTETPPSGAFFWYLVTATNACGQGPAGNATAGPRIVNTSGNCDPTCSDTALDGSETDIDCGGPICAPCADNKNCLVPSDCASGVCTAGVCAAPSCVDTVQNGSETGVDCGGGGGCPTCSIGQTCCAGIDCLSATCSTDICVINPCADGVLDGSETDIDCGGGACAACATGKLCNVASDCQSSVCTTGHCAAPSCTDGVKNGNETGVDCGFTSCGFCPDQQGCLANSDCSSGICQGGTCQTASCTPGLAAAESPKAPLAECGSSGNTFWTYTAAAASTTSVMDDTNGNFYLGSGTTLTRLDPATGAPLNSRDFFSVTLTRPIVPRLQGSLTNAVFVGGSDGAAYSCNPDTLANVWSRSLRRSTCTSDAIAAAPVFLRRDLADANFQAARTQDLVIFGTDYACGTTSANKVYALDASSGNVVWIFNATGTSFSVDRVGGLAVDYGHNLIYVVSHKTDPSGTQSTVWALKATTGTRVWSEDFGSVDVAPVFSDGKLYVATTIGTLAKLDPTTGSPIWSTAFTSGGATTTSLSVQVAFSTASIYVVDTAGIIHSLLDNCTSVGSIWATNVTGALADTAPAVVGPAGKLYVGAHDGRVYQLDTTTGANDSYATIGGIGTSSSDPFVYFEVNAPRLIASAGGVVKRLCIPWLADHGDKAFLSVPPGVGPDAPAEALQLGHSGTSEGGGRCVPDALEFRAPRIDQPEHPSSTRSP
jgi:outer membrane protein assembly factor BamB